MGSFAGHVDEATFFLIIALWWMYNSFTEYIKATWQGEEFRCRPSYAWPGKPKIPVESIFKILFPVAGFLAEVFIDGPHFVDENNRLMGINHMQHMSIYGMFALHGIIDIMRHWGAPIPRGLVYLSMALCFWWYGLSFVFHVQMEGKEGMETIIHLMPTYAMFGISITMIVEMIRPSWFMAELARIYAILILGTWFWQTSFMMYLPTPFPGNFSNPAWDRKDPRNVHFLVALFGYHMCLHLVVITVIYLITMFVLKVRGEHKPRYKQLARLAEDEEEVTGSLIHGRHL